MSVLSRRRFLAISAASAAMPSLSAASQADARWAGTALGARASMRFAGLDQPEADPIIATVEAELNRLELIFSLYRPESELCRLNRDGVLRHPSPELLNVLSLCAALNDASDGAFDPTVQPLWLALAQGATGAELDIARSKLGWHHVRFDAGAVRFAPGAPEGMGLTLNGIAQGAVTDRISSLLRSHGLRNVLVDMGEIAALGRRADGAPWRAGIADSRGRVVQHVTLSDRAVATSAPSASLLNVETRQGHILDPRNSDLPTRALVSVAADSAVVADGLSTALCLLPSDRSAGVLKRFAMAKPELMI